MFELGTKLRVILNKNPWNLSSTITIYDDKLEHWRDLHPEETIILNETSINHWKKLNFKFEEFCTTYLLKYIGPK